MVPIDTDRRTVLSQHEMPLADRAQQRGALAEVKQALEGLDDRTRRKGLLLVTALALQGSMLQGPGSAQTIRLEVDRLPDRLRISASASEDVMPPSFWEVVGGAAATVFADAWQLERDGLGAWFEIERLGL